MHILTYELGVDLQVDIEVFFRIVVLMDKRVHEAVPLSVKCKKSWKCCISSRSPSSAIILIDLLMPVQPVLLIEFRSRKWVNVADSDTGMKYPWCAELWLLSICAVSQRRCKSIPAWTHTNTETVCPGTLLGTPICSFVHLILRF